MPLIMDLPLVTIIEGAIEGSHPLHLDMAIHQIGTPLVLNLAENLPCDALWI